MVVTVQAPEVFTVSSSSSAFISDPSDFCSELNVFSISDFWFLYLFFFNLIFKTLSIFLDHLRGPFQFWGNMIFVFLFSFSCVASDFRLVRYP